MCSTLFASIAFGLAFFPGDTHCTLAVNGPGTEAVSGLAGISSDVENEVKPILSAIVICGPITM